MERIVRKAFEYYQGERLIFRLGYVQLKDAGSPMELHSHGKMTEYVILEKGFQKYQVEGEEYMLHPGEVFVAHPYEEHNTGTSPEEKTSLYYLIVDLEEILANSWGCNRVDLDEMRNYYTKRRERIGKAPDRLLQALCCLKKVMEGKEQFRETRIRNAMSEVLILLTEIQFGQAIKAIGEMDKCLNYITEHVKEEIPLEILAQTEGMSLSTFKFHFKKKTGIPPGEFILREKIEYAKKRLKESTDSITDIAFSCGFSSSQYFATVFRRFCYVTPSQYRKDVELQQ